MTVTETVYFGRKGLFVILTFRFDVEKGTAHCDMSFRMVRPVQAVELQDAVQLFRTWVNAVNDGQFPPLPPGWRLLKDGIPAGATGGTPDRHH